MSNLLVLLKNSFINSTGINSLSKGVRTSRDKRKLMFSAFMLLFIAALMVAMSTGYSIALASLLQLTGHLDLLLIIVILVCTLLNFFTTIYKAQGTLFNAKDYDLLMSLPIKNSTILTSKLLSMMVINYVVTSLIVVPASIVYFVYNGSLSAVYFLVLIIGLIFIPMIPIVVASIVAVIIAFLSSRFKHKNIATVIIGMAILLIIMGIMFNIQYYINEFIANSESIAAGLSSVYKPALYLKEAMINSDFISLCKFIGISIVPFIIFIFAFAKTFKVINSKISETYRKADYKVGNLETDSVLKAITIVELRKYLAIPVYIFNTAFGMVLLVAASIATLFLSRESILDMLGYSVIEELIPMMALVLLAFTIGLSCTTNSSISLEGNRLWILKSLPIDVKEIFKGKIAMNLIVTVPATIISNVLLFIGLKYNVKYLVFNLVISILFAIVMAVIGLIVNLYFPKLKWTNPTTVVKQSISVLITIIFVFGVIALGIYAVVLFKISNFTIFLSAVTVVLLIMLAVSWRILMTKGVTNFKEL